MLRAVGAVLPPILEAWADADVLIESKSSEDVAVTGCNIRLACVQQCVQTLTLWGQFAILLEACHKTHRSYLTFSLACLAPFAAGLFKHVMKDSSHHTVKIIADVLHSHMGSLCQIASLAVSVALLRLGHRAYAITSVTILSFGYLMRRHYVPLPLMGCYRRISLLACPMGNILYKSWTFKLLTLFQACNDLYPTLMQLRHPTPSQTPYAQTDHPSHLSSLEQLNEVVSGKTAVQVNRAHVLIEPFPSFPPADTQVLLQFCANFEWNRDLLSQEIAADARWTSYAVRVGYDQIILDQAKQDCQVAYAKNQFKTLVESVQNQKIQTKEVLNYGVLKNYLNCVAAKLSSVDPEVQQHVMIQLAVEGGDYCGTGIYSQLGSAAFYLLSNATPKAQERQQLPLKQRILLLLQQERLKIITGYHQIVSDLGVHIACGGKGDLHPLNRTINWLGSDFGLPDQGASGDVPMQVSAAMKIYLSQLYRVSPEDLWIDAGYLERIRGEMEKDKDGNEKRAEDTYRPIEGYMVDRIIKALEPSIGLSLLPQPDINTWAFQWAAQHLDEEEQATFALRVTGDFRKFNGMPTGSFLKAMLVDMGVFSIKKD